MGIGVNLIAAGSFIDSAVNAQNRKHILLQIDKKTGLYSPNLIFKVNTATARGTTDTNTGNLHTFRSQSFIIDKNAAGASIGMYYAFMDRPTSPTANDVLHYASLTESTFAVEYELDLTIGILWTMQTWVSI